jgi:hypothetical protein
LPVAFATGLPVALVDATDRAPAVFAACEVVPDARLATGAFDLTVAFALPGVCAGDFAAFALALPPAAALRAVAPAFGAALAETAFDAAPLGADLALAVFTLALELPFAPAAFAVALTAAFFGVPAGLDAGAFFVATRATDFPGLAAAAFAAGTFAWVAALPVAPLRLAAPATDLPAETGRSTDVTTVDFLMLTLNPFGKLGETGLRRIAARRTIWASAQGGSPRAKKNPSLYQDL